mmetsp:Transcript_158066/g.507060  ORF Transcript_158066/g.507060 Transcript_158066/m.507060 type:complete len:299 (-) Transcript_158066:1813-2709(-)
MQPISEVVGRRQFNRLGDVEPNVPRQCAQTKLVLRCGEFILSAIQSHPPLAGPWQPLYQGGSLAFEGLVQHSTEAYLRPRLPRAVLVADELQLDVRAFQSHGVRGDVADGEAALRQHLLQGRAALQHGGIHRPLESQDRTFFARVELTLSTLQPQAIAFKGQLFSVGEDMKSLRTHHLQPDVVHLNSGARQRCSEHVPRGHNRRDALRENLHHAQLIGLQGEENTAAAHVHVVPIERALRQHRLLVDVPRHADLAGRGAALGPALDQDLDAPHQARAVRDLYAPLGHAPAARELAGGL